MEKCRAVVECPNGLKADFAMICNGNGLMKSLRLGNGSLLYFVLATDLYEGDVVAVRHKRNRCTKLVRIYYGGEGGVILRTDMGETRYKICDIEILGRVIGYWTPLTGLDLVQGRRAEFITLRPEGEIPQLEGTILRLEGEDE